MDNSTTPNPTPASVAAPVQAPSPASTPTPAPAPATPAAKKPPVLMIALTVITAIAAGIAIVEAFQIADLKSELEQQRSSGSRSSIIDSKSSSNTSNTSSTGSPYTNMRKPIIYLYPEQETKVSVTLGYPELLTTVYPEYNNGWNVIARPDGSLTDLATGRNLYALYWEGKAKNKPALDEGFVVAGKDSAKFLEEKLARLGLNEREAEEFIVYWLPKLESSPYNLIRFETKNEIEANMPLTVSPKPDTTIRVMMDFLPLETPINIPEQSLPETPERNGFTVVEWGGSDMSGNSLLQ